MFFFKFCKIFKNICLQNTSDGCFWTEYSNFSLQITCLVQGRSRAAHLFLINRFFAGLIHNTGKGQHFISTVISWNSKDCIIVFNENIKMMMGKSRTTIFTCEFEFFWWSNLIYNTSARHEGHECDTSATRTTRVRHEWKILITTRVKTFSHPYIYYMTTERLQGEKQLHSKNDLLETPRSHAKMRLKSAPPNTELFNG